MSGTTSVPGLWDRLVSVALVGTERKPVPDELVAGVGTLVGDVPGPRAEDVVLTAAAALATYRRVGQGAAHGDGPVPAPMGDDGRQPVSAAAGQLLGLLVDGHVRVLGGPVPLIDDWLRRCAATGRRPPERLLPALLDHATRVRALRPAVVAAGGATVAWLGRQNPAWEWAADEPSRTEGGPTDGGDVWRTGTSAARMAWLGERRAVDPGDARRQVEDTWKGESAKDRALIVAALRAGLGPDDEAFLEAALDDRAAAVRVAAADLLAGLPTSALAGRMAERVRALVAGPPWRVALPESIDAAARRDGVVDTGAPAATGKRTWWLIQMVGAAPLSIWPAPADAVDRAPSDLVRGWVRAAGRQGDADWSRALLRVAPDPALLAALPPGAARDLLPVGLEHAPDPALAGLLAATPGPWPELLSRWVVQRLRAATQAAAVDRALVGLAGAADVATIADLERWIDDLEKHDHLRVALAHVTHALSIRHAIAQELP